MRLLILVFISFLSLVFTAKSQNTSGIFGFAAETGTYTLMDDRRVHYTGKLKVLSHELIAKDDRGVTTKWQPNEVYSVRIGPQRYTTAHGFRTKSGFGSRGQEESVFVELLDSGTVSLMRYHYSVGAPGMDSQLTAYLLQEASQDTAVTIPVMYTGKGKRFRDALAPYVANRTDLLQLLDDGLINIDELPDFIHALNSGQPFPSGIKILDDKPKKVKERRIKDPFSD